MPYNSAAQPGIKNRPWLIASAVLFAAFILATLGMPRPVSASEAFLSIALLGLAVGGATKAWRRGETTIWVAILEFAIGAFFWRVCLWYVNGI